MVRMTCKQEFRRPAYETNYYLQSQVRRCEIGARVFSLSWQWRVQCLKVPGNGVHPPPVFLFFLLFLVAASVHLFLPLITSGIYLLLCTCRK